MWRFLFGILMAVQSFATCLPVSGDRIYAKDLLGAVPAFSALPENTVLGYAPIPGATRVFEVAELQNIARAHRLDLGPAARVCFAVPQVSHLSEEDVLSSMRRVLPAHASLDLVDLMKAPVPVGDTVFPLESLEPPQPADPSLQSWKGYVRYAGTRRMPVWARVRITVERPVVVALRALKPGETIGPDAVAEEIRKGPLRLDAAASHASDVVGRAVVRGVKAGEPVAASMLEAAVVIRRGDPVRVEVLNGSAKLSFSALAEANGREGEFVELRNPSSGKVFRARAVGAGTAVVAVASSGLGKSE